jgi:hypothetical protein
MKNEVATLKAEIITSEASFGKKTLEHYRQQGERAAKLRNLIKTGWEQVCKEMGFTTQAVGNWIRLADKWATIEEKVNTGEVKSLTDALKGLPKSKSGPRAKSKPEAGTLDAVILEALERAGIKTQVKKAISFLTYCGVTTDHLEALKTRHTGLRLVK